MAGEAAVPPLSWERTPRVLMVAYVSGRHPIGGGVSVFNENLTNALARDYDVTLLMSSPEHEHPGAKVATVDPERIAFDEFPRLALHLTPEEVGLPRERDAFDLIVSHNEFLGEAAVRVREEWYPDARYAHGVHTAAEKYRRLLEQPELGKQEADRHRWIMGQMRDTDLLFGVGDPLTDEALRMAQTIEAGPKDLRSHELIPGIQRLPETQSPAGRPGFTVYSVGRLEDPIKGQDQLFEAVRRLRQHGHDIRVRSRGVPPDSVDTAQQNVDRRMGEPGVVQILPFSSDSAELDAEMRAADMVVMPSLHEGFGLVALEALERSVPLLVNEDSGMAQFLMNHPDVPRELGRLCVVKDNELDSDQCVTAWAEALLDASSNRAARWENAQRLWQVGHRFSWEQCGPPLVHASLMDVRGDPNMPRHTRQGGDGKLLIAQQRDTAGRNRRLFRREAPLRFQAVPRKSQRRPRGPSDGPGHGFRPRPGR